MTFILCDLLFSAFQITAGGAALTAVVAVAVTLILDPSRRLRRVEVAEKLLRLRQKHAG